MTNDQPPGATAGAVTSALADRSRRELVQL
jgi:hypothetical protein